MKKLTLTLAVLLSVNSFASTKEESILKVSKTMNSKNILHYKVKYDSNTCELKGNVYAEWKMDEEDGQWKPLSESMGMIKRPLEPKPRAKTNYEIEFITDSMSDFQKKKILSADKVRVIIDQTDEGKCTLKNEIEVQNEVINVSQIHSDVSLFGNVKWVQIIGHKENGHKIVLAVDHNGKRIDHTDLKKGFLPVN